MCWRSSSARASRTPHAAAPATRISWLPVPAVRPLNRKYRRAGGLARRQVGVRFGRVLQRIGLIDLDLDDALDDDIEQFLGAGDQVFALGGIGIERRPGDVKRALLRQQTEI